MVKTTDFAKELAGDPANLLITTEEYCLKQLPDAFENFDEVILPLLSNHQDNVYDITVFYSRRKGITVPDHESLLRHNQHAFDAAQQIPGLVIYFQGHLLTQPDEKHLDPKLHLAFTPDCLSFCIWESLDHAKAGAALPEHREAASHVGRWYGGFAIKKYTLHVQTSATKGGQQPTIIFEEYERVESLVAE